MCPDETTSLGTTDVEMPALDTPADTPAEPAFHKIGPTVSAKIAGDDVQANLSAIASLDAGSLSATGSAIGAASIDGDATITASMMPAAIVRGNATIQQSYVSAAIVGGDTKVHQAVAPLIIGKTMDVSQGGGAVLLSGEANVTKSWVGIVLSPKTTISEDSRVLISTKAALIIAFAVFGGFALVALVGWLGVRRLMRWRPSIALPALPKFTKSLPEFTKSLPDFRALAEAWKQQRTA